MSSGKQFSRRTAIAGIAAAALAPQSGRAQANPIPKGVVAGRLEALWARRATPGLTVKPAKRVGVDKLPTGVRLSGSILIIDAPVQLDGWDLRGPSVHTGRRAEGYGIRNSLMRVDSDDYLLRHGEGGEVAGTISNTLGDFSSRSVSWSGVVTRPGSKITLRNVVASNAAVGYLLLYHDSEIQNCVFGTLGGHCKDDAHLEAIWYGGGRHLLEDCLVDATGTRTQAASSGNIFISGGTGPVEIECRRTIFAGMVDAKGFYTIQGRSDYSPYRCQFDACVLQAGKSGAPRGYFGKNGHQGKALASSNFDLDSGASIDAMIRNQGSD